LKAVAISTGHSNLDPGAIGLDGVKEFDLNVRLTKEILKRPLRHGSWHLVDRDCENLPYPDHLYKTVRNINKGDFACCLEIHHNGSINPNTRGGMVVFYDRSQKGHEFADIVNRFLMLLPFYHVAERLINPMGVIVYWRMFQGQHYPSQSVATLRHLKRRLYYLRKTKPPAIIVEPGYISNRKDFNIVWHYVRDIAFAISSGVDLYLRAR
jgi:N-acetylmuramoyl-L-alanine amidase